MKLLFGWPAAQYSTYDVANGLHQALEADGHSLVDYRLYRRLGLSYDSIKSMVPEGFVPDSNEVCLHASEALPYMALLHRTPWALIVNGHALHPNAVLTLRRAGVRVAVWFTEAPYESNDEQELYLAQLCDVAFVNERTSVGAFQSVLDKAGNGGAAYYLPHAFNPALHRPWQDDDEPLDPTRSSDVLFVGTGFAERVRMLEAVDWTGINLVLGGLLPGVQPPSFVMRHLKYECLDNRQTIALYHGTKIVWNPHRWSATAESANPRTFEAAACGAFQLADERAEIADVFGDSVATYRPGVPWDLAAKLRRYLADEPTRRNMAEEARRRVQGQTFAARAKVVMDAIEYHDRQRSPKLRVLAGVA